MEEISNDWKKVKSKHSFKPTILHTSNIPPKKRFIIAKGDSAASNHYWALRDSIILDNLSDDDNAPSVTLPDKSTITAIKRGQIPVPNLSSNATETKVFTDLNHSLISLGQLCDDNCDILLTKENYLLTKIIKRF